MKKELNNRITILLQDAVLEALEKRDNQIRKEAQQETAEAIFDDIERVFDVKEDCLVFVCKSCGTCWSSMKEVVICDECQGGCGSKEIMGFIDIDSFKELLNEVKRNEKICNLVSK